MSTTRKPLEELAVDLLFETLGEHRYNRTPADYRRLTKLIPHLKEAHHLVNQRLKELHEAGRFFDRAICDFKAGDRYPFYRSYPTIISLESIRSGLITAGFRRPRTRRRRK